MERLPRRVANGGLCLPIRVFLLPGREPGTDDHEVDECRHACPRHAIHAVVSVAAEARAVEVGDGGDRDRDRQRTEEPAFFQQCPETGAEELTDEKTAG